MKEIIEDQFEIGKYKQEENKKDLFCEHFGLQDEYFDDEEFEEWRKKEFRLTESETKNDSSI